MELIKPDIFVSLTEEKTDGEFKGYKSVKRCIEKSIKFLEDTVAFKNEDEDLTNVKIYSPFQGEDSLELRETH